MLRLNAARAVVRASFVAPRHVARSSLVHWAASLSSVAADNNAPAAPPPPPPLAQQPCRRCGALVPSGRICSCMVREGDWVCPNCRAAVFARSAACYKCHEPRPANPEYCVGAPAAASGAAADAQAQGEQSCRRCGSSLTPGQRCACLPPLREGDWYCPSCRAAVFARSSACFKCSTPMPANPEYCVGPPQPGWQAPQQAPPRRSFDDRQRDFRFERAPQQRRREWDNQRPDFNKRGGPERRPGDWDCACGAHVFGSRTQCYKCGAPRR